MGRPSRVIQWNISVQREVFETWLWKQPLLATYGLENAGSSQGSVCELGNLINYDAVSPATLQRYGLGDLTNANTRSLLNSTITSAAAVAAGFKKPYANFPIRARCSRVCGHFRSTAASASYRRRWGFLV